MSNTQLPPNATSLSEQADPTRGSPINDDDPHAALELVRDAIVLHHSDKSQTTIERNPYRVNFTAAPEDWHAQHAVALACITNQVVPDARNPGATIKTYATCWIEPLDVAQKMVTDYLGENALGGFTPPQEGR